MKEIKDIVERLRALGFEAKINNTEVRRPASPGPSLDYAELSEKEFRRVVSRIDDINILAGMANRRKLLSAPWLKKYSPVQRSIILERKFQLEQKAKVNDNSRGRGKNR